MARSPLALGTVGLLLSPAWVWMDLLAWPLPVLVTAVCPQCYGSPQLRSLSPDYSLGAWDVEGAGPLGWGGALLAAPEANRGFCARGSPFPAWPIKPRSKTWAHCRLTQNRSHWIQADRVPPRWTVQAREGVVPPYHRKLRFLTSPASG